MRRWIALALALAALAAALPARAHPALELAACTENRLRNPGFEEAFTPGVRAEEMVAFGWTAWYETFPGIGGINYAPRYAPLRLDRNGPDQVLSGLWAQGLSTGDATHTGGLLQQVDVPPKSQILAQAVVRAWSSDGEDRSVSEPAGLYVASLGVDPFGGTDPHSDRMKWMQPITVTDAWTPLLLDTAVEGPRVTLFLRGQAARPLAHHEARWDQICLSVIGPAGVPTPSPTDRPPPTRTRDPNAPVPTPGPGTREALAAARVSELLGTATARAMPVGARIVTAQPTITRVPTPARPGIAASASRHSGLLLLGLGALIGGLLLSAKRPAPAAPEQADATEDPGSAPEGAANDPGSPPEGADQSGL